MKTMIQFAVFFAGVVAGAGMRVLMILTEAGWR